jgi:hypothetical protein
MFIKTIIFLLLVVASPLCALPVSLIKNRTFDSIVIDNAFSIKTRSVTRIKNLEIPFTSWLLNRCAVIDGDEYCPEKYLRIVAGSRTWMIWTNELGIWGLILDESMPLSPNDRKPVLFIKAKDMLKPQAIILIDDEKLEIYA